MCVHMGHLGAMPYGCGDRYATSVVSGIFGWSNGLTNGREGEVIDTHMSGQYPNL